VDGTLLAQTPADREVEMPAFERIDHPLLGAAAKHDETLRLQSSIPAGVPVTATDSLLASTDSARVKPGIDWTRIGIATGSLAVAVGALHIYQMNAWWKNDRGPFHVIEDPEYMANFDKAGHTFGAYYSSHFFQEAYEWAGMDSAQSDVLGALSGVFWEFYVEIEDGFATQWGFSRGDAKADIAGASFFLLRNRVPFLRNFNYKWAYFPSQKYIKNQPDIPGQTLNFIEDYGGQSYWMSMDVNGMLPEVAKAYWPKWLKLAVGVAGYNIDVRDFSKRKKAWLVALDYDLGSLIPESSSGFLNFVRRGLNYWHFPAPAYRFYPDPRFFVLFPLQMTL
jgi:hypothetical protein